MRQRQLGSYRLLEEIGSGGMGAVYRATAADGTTVALKVIHPHLVGKEGFRARFAREVELGHRIRDDNVVATLDAGEAAVDGKPTLYLAMELVEGQTLRNLLDELGIVPEDLCLHIGREVARALVAIHGAGVLHRDIKPENVLITKDSRIKVMDLGVALIADESLRLSQSGVFVGSILYAAPERFDDLPADGRADLYNLGLLLYELATGQHPFQADDWSAVVQKQLRSRPRAPSKLNPQLSPFFEEVVLNLMDKDRDRRLPSAADLLAVLEEEEQSDWWLRRARTLRSRAPGALRRIRVPHETPLVGRESEMALLETLYAGVRGGESRTLLVEGEAGIGKSRLIEEFAERLVERGDDIHFLSGSYPPGGAATAAGAFSSAYREFFGSESLEEHLAACFAGAPGMVPAFAALLVGAPPPPGVAPLSRDALLHAFALATRALAAQKPTIVFIEDLHFAPELGRAIFASLTTALENHPVLLIGTARPGVPEKWADDLARLDSFTRLELPRLTPKELAALLVELFRSEQLASELGWTIATKSDGNPFFVFELVRALREDQLIAREADGTWVQTGLIRNLQMPSSVLDLVEARIRDLEEIDRDLLEVASCCGFEFDPLLVAAVLELDQIPAMKRFAHLEKKHRLVRAVGRHYVFDHHQVQEALYRALPELLREPYHAKLGAALEARAKEGEVPGDVAVELCEHFLAGAVADRAQRYLGPALTHLRDGYLHDEAIELAQRALAVDGLLRGEERVNVLMQTAANLEQRGRHQEDRAVLEEALALADALGDPALRSTVRTQLGRLNVWTSNYGAARDWLVDARDLAREAGDQRLERAAVGNLGVVHYRERRYEEARRIFEEVAEAARQRGDKRSWAVGMLNLGNIHWLRGEWEEARVRYEKYRDLSREIGYREGEALAAGNLGNVHFSQGRLAEARAHYEEVLRLAGAIGDRHKIVIFEGSLGAIDLTLGRLDRARTHFERSLALARDVGMPREESHALGGLGDIREQEGDLEGARSLKERSLALAEAIGEGDGVAATRIDLARIAVAEGREEDAVRLLDAAAVNGRSAGDAAQEVKACVARACLAGGDVAAAEEMLRASGERMSLLARMYAHFQLFQATGKPEHREEARTLLLRIRDGAPEEDQASMLESNPVYRALYGAR